MVSVIITTKNEERHIENCLESIKNQSYLTNLCNKSDEKSGVEIIVVDNNSSDKTKEISQRYTDKIYNYGPERSAQRNFGVKHANGKYILYLDADMILSENVIKECVEKCENEGSIALYIPERIINLSSNQLNNLCNPSFNHCNHSFNLRNQSFWIKVRDFERSFYNATCIDAVRFIRRDKFLEIGGFDENLTGPEDWDFDRRIRRIGRVDIIEAKIYHNEGKFNLSRYVKKKSYYAQSFAGYIQKWGRGDVIISKQLGLWYRFFYIFIENKKWKRFLISPILFYGFYILKILTVLRYIQQKLGPRRNESRIKIT